MRFVSSLPPVTSPPGNREVKRVFGVRAVRPVATQEKPVEEVGRYAHQQNPEEALPQSSGEHRHEGLPDRRKYCRRINHFPVLFDLRSGVERRRHHQRERDAVEHIDEQV